MKRLTSFIFLLFTTISLLGQSWFSNTSNWYYSYASFANRGFVQIQYEKDTTVIGQNCKKLTRTLVVFDQIVQSTDTVNYPPLFVYEQNEIAYVYTQNQFDTLYNLNATQGSSWAYYYGPGHPLTDVTVIVMDTGSMMVNGVNLKFLEVEIQNNFQPNYPGIPILDTIVQYIGPLNSYFLPWEGAFGQIDGHEGGEFRCFEDDTIGLVKYYNNDCDYHPGMTVANKEVKNDVSKLQLFPNPFHDYLVINSDKRPINEVRIFDSKGSLLTEYEIIGNRLNLQNIPSGIYFLHIQLDEESVVKKIIKQN